MQGMKKIAILSLSIAPLVAGCAAIHGPELEAEQAAAAQTTSEIASLRSRVRKLNRRVRVLGKRVSKQEPSIIETQTIVNRTDDAELAAVKRRLAGLEARIKAPSSSSVRIAGSYGDQSELIAELQRRLKALEVTRNTVTIGKGNPANGQKLARAEAKLASFVKKFSNMEKELDRDRTLVVDYLEDLDKRLEALEKASGIPPARQPKP